jgi:hypothetical protein
MVTFARSHKLAFALRPRRYTQTKPTPAALSDSAEHVLAPAVRKNANVSRKTQTRDSAKHHNKNGVGVTAFKSGLM